MKAVVDKETCIGCGLCTNICPAVFDMDDDGLGKMMVFAKKVAQAMKMAVPCVKIGVSVIGLEVPHAHIHLIPMNQVSDMNFSRQKLSVTKEELSSTAKLISSYIK